LEKQSPVTRRGGIFFFSSLGLVRPEIVRFRQRLLDRYSPPQNARVLLLLPQTLKKPFHTSKEHESVMEQMRQILGDIVDIIHVCTYSAPFGVVPGELDDVYPVSQNVIAYPFDYETLRYVAQQVADYIKNTNYKRVVLLRDPTIWRGKIAVACRQACKKRAIALVILSERDPWAKNTIEHLVQELSNAVALP